MEGRNDGSKKTELLEAFYTVSAGGSKYVLFFAYFPVNDVINPLNVGIYAMGVTPLTDDDPQFGPQALFSAWAGSMSFDEQDERFQMSYPGVYFPVYDGPQVTNYVMTRIVEEINAKDALELEWWFAEDVQLAMEGKLSAQIDELFAEFSEGDLTWERLQDGPLARRAPEGGGEAVLLLPTYQASAGGQAYWLSFAVFTQNTIDPTKIGINAIGVAPRTESGDSPQELALFSWLDSFQVDAAPTPGIFIAE